MLKMYKNHVISVILVAVLLPFIKISGAERVISLAVAEWPPYVSNALKDYGFTSEIVAEAFTRVGYTVKMSFMPWKRALHKVAEGVYDATYPAYYSEERAQLYAVSQPFFAAPMGFYKRKDRAIAYQNLQDLQAYTIGVVRAYVNTAEFDAAAYLKKDIADDDEQNLKKLLKGRVDLIIIDKFTAQHMLNTRIPEGKALLEFLEPPLDIKSFHLLVSRNIKNSEQTLHDFHRGLQEIVADGTISRILQKHNLE
jgi:polar amino acid transport system substrate-binding protein